MDPDQGRRLVVVNWRNAPSFSSHLSLHSLLSSLQLHLQLHATLATMATGRRRRPKEVDQIEADRLLAERLRKQWEEEDGLMVKHLPRLTFSDYDFGFGLVDHSLLDEDYMLAKKIQEHGDIEDGDVNMAGSVIDPSLELKDPAPDIWHLFRCFDARFFDRTLVSSGVELSWSPRMTMCAGLCGWNPRSKACFIRLSKPLLELRPRKDLVETLIHEMIHALLFVKRIDDNHESHGQVFHQHMRRINLEGQCKVTVFHDFHDEVRHFKSHVWRCSGPCKDRPPYHGWVRRAMNRPPGPSDPWFYSHETTCGGHWVKVSEPENFRSKKKVEGGDGTKGKGGRKKKQESAKVPPSQDLRNFFTPISSQSNSASAALTTSSTNEQNAESSKCATAVIVEIDLE